MQALLAAWLLSILLSIPGAAAATAPQAQAEPAHYLPPHGIYSLEESGYYLSQLTIDAQGMTTWFTVAKLAPVQYTTQKLAEIQEARNGWAFVDGEAGFLIIGNEEEPGVAYFERAYDGTPDASIYAGTYEGLDKSGNMRLVTIDDETVTVEDKESGRQQAFPYTYDRGALAVDAGPGIGICHVLYRDGGIFLRAENGYQAMLPRALDATEFYGVYGHPLEGTALYTPQLRIDRTRIEWTGGEEALGGWKVPYRRDGDALLDLSLGGNIRIERTPEGVVLSRALEGDSFPLTRIPDDVLASSQQRSGVFHYDQDTEAAVLRQVRPFFGTYALWDDAGKLIRVAHIDRDWVTLLAPSMLTNVALPYTAYGDDMDASGLQIDKRPDGIFVHGGDILLGGDALYTRVTEENPLPDILAD